MVRLSYLFILLLLVVISCRENCSIQNSKGQSHKSENSLASKLSFKSPENGQVIRIGENVSLLAQYRDTVSMPDSVQFLVDAFRIGSLQKINKTITMSTANAKAGSHIISAIAYFSSGLREQVNVGVKFYPGNQAPIYTYKVVNTYPHNRDAYTQGLVFDKGELLESTGLKGKSSLRRVKYETGEILKSYKLPDDIFGEGIASYDNKILQISWQDQVAFLYDKATFALVNKLNYAFKEGWGLTFDGTDLIMSDGSANLYILDKEYLTEKGHLEVCDDRGPVEKLNELEYIDGEVWANVYYTDTIVRIDPKTGIILGKIDLTGLLKAEDHDAETNVLNGIAYNPQTKCIWVTGKNWPKLFQITVTQKGR